MNLDGSHPSQKSSLFDSVDIQLIALGSGVQLMASADNVSVALWKGQGAEPGQAECDEATDTGGLMAASLRQGAVVCVRTDQNRIARLKVVKSSEVNFAAVVEFETVVWKPAA
jgi:hypothetical protein